MRKRLFEIIEIAADGDRASRFYDGFMILVIILSIIPIAMKDPGTVWNALDKLCVAIFIVDYALRLFTADFKLEDRRRAFSFLRYPLTPMAVIDLLSILPSFIPVNRSLRLLRLFRALRVFRIFRVLRYSKSLRTVSVVMKKSKDSLIAVYSLAAVYIVISALVILNAEPRSFDSFFEALYWATTSLATVGYGDIYPVTAVGKAISMISSMMGIAIVALPSSIITAGYVEEIKKRESGDEQKDKD